MIKILKYGQVKKEEIFERAVSKADVSSTVAEIIENVKKNDDKALLYYNEKFDKAHIDTLAVSPDEIENALKTVDSDFLRILNSAADNIRAFTKNKSVKVLKSKRTAR